jgi:hypothetical protein
VLSVSPTGTQYITCGTPPGYPPVYVSNTGGGTLHWQATATNGQVTLSPASGSLSGGQTQTLTLSTTGSAATDVDFTSNGGSATISFMCNPG